MEAHAAVVENVFDAAREKLEEMAQRLESQVALGSTHSEVEEYVVAEGREVQRRMLQAHLTLRKLAERPVQVVGNDGVERAERRASHRTLRSVVGEVVVERLLYQAAGVEGLAPLDASLNLPADSYSMGVRRRVAEEVAAGSYDHAVERIAATTGADVGKRQVEALARRAAQDFTAFYTALPGNDVVDDSKRLLVMQFDAAGIVMRKQDLREATRRAAEKQEKAHRQPSKRLHKGQKRNRKRMAQLSVIYSIEPHIREPEDIVRELRPVHDTTPKKAPPRPVNKRAWASVERDSDVVIEEAFQEALRRDPHQERHWIVLVDGNETQLEIIRATAARLNVHVTIILDVIHVLEYLWKAAYNFHNEGSKQADEWVTKRLVMLLNGVSASDVAAGMTRSATLKKLANRKAVQKCAWYLCKYRDLIQYAVALANGLPIATGVIEGACRYLVRDRMDKTGARWSLLGAEAILKLRALRANGDFAAYWKYHLSAEQARNHAARYADNIVPSPLPIREGLKLVK